MWVCIPPTICWMQLEVLLKTLAETLHQRLNLSVYYMLSVYCLLSACHHWCLQTQYSDSRNSISTTRHLPVRIVRFDLLLTLLVRLRLLLRDRCLCSNKIELLHNLIHGIFQLPLAAIVL